MDTLNSGLLHPPDVCVPEPYRATPCVLAVFIATYSVRGRDEFACLSLTSELGLDVGLCASKSACSSRMLCILDVPSASLGYSIFIAEVRKHPQWNCLGPSRATIEASVISKSWSHYLSVITLDWKYSSCPQNSLLEDHNQVEPHRLKLLGGKNVGKTNSSGLTWHCSRPSTDNKSSAISDFLLTTHLWSIAFFYHNYSFLLGNELVYLRSHNKAPQTR